ncbi:MAG: hypothetical protein JWM20_331 [Patescibacteria group bacterium]|nr:hypothetical protein [Patescibacteria group bacterium]
MNPTFTPPIEKQKPLEKNPADFAYEFLGDAIEHLHEDQIAAIVERAKSSQSEILESIKTPSEHSRNVSYDKFKKRFSVAGEEGVTMGQIIAARHMGMDVTIPEEVDQSGDGKKLRRILAEKISQDRIANDANRELGTVLSEKAKMRDMMKSEAYRKIAERSGVESEQLGVKAEQIVMGALETIAIDRPDLGLSIASANAYQDVEEKIDFIISTKQKKRGIGIEKDEVSFDEKHIGIQFTINTSKREHKEDQIKKAKARGMDVDDILYVAIDMKILSLAISSWKKDGKSIKGPWSYLPESVRKAAIANLFDSVLTQDQVRGLVESA